ncbi:MAG: TetR/AcrR family transcriptional regulator [Chthoniobacterales bacterium]
MNSDSPRTSYHHGNARNALLQAAADLLEQTGAAGLALRQLAERAGLSRQAPYNHFADKETLLSELVRNGFDRLSREIEAVRRSRAKPVVRLARAAECYIAFAESSPALFRLMFSKELVDPSRHPAAQEAASASFQQLAAIVSTLTSPETVADLSLVAWSLVHGYATLCIEAAVEGPERRGARARLFASTIARSATGSQPRITVHGRRASASTF